MKNKILAFAAVLAAMLLQPRAYAECLPSTVTVYDENLQPVQVDPYQLERNSLFKGRLTVDEKGVASFSASSTDSFNPCWNDAPRFYCQCAKYRQQGKVQDPNVVIQCFY